MRAVVLVGGYGTRLRPLTLHRPKQLLPVVDRPMIEWVLGALGAHGIDDAVLSLGYRPDAFAAAYPDGRCAGVALHYAVEPEPLDTAGAVRFAARDAGITGRFLVVNGDVLTDLDVSALIEFHDEAGAEATIALHEVDDPSRFGVVPTDDAGRVVAFVEKPALAEAPTRMINAGTYVLEPTVVERIPGGRRVSIERETFPSLAADGTLYGMPDGDAYWIDTGTPAQYLQSQLDVIDGVRGPAPAPLSAMASIAKDALVERSVVMDGVVVEGGAEVRDAAVLSGARIGRGAHVSGSIVGPGSVVGAGAKIVDGSVLGDGVVIADGETICGERIPAPD
ncbi:MAG: sugar phosphate nucleotidyltransferase [Acidimicrobiales bacterium]